jgi:hypothetical protein
MNLHSLFNHFYQLHEGERSIPSKGFIKASLVIAAHAPAVAKISNNIKILYQWLPDDVHDPYFLLNTVLQFHMSKNRLHVQVLKNQTT